MDFKQFLEELISLNASMLLFEPIIEGIRVREVFKTDLKNFCCIQKNEIDFIY